MKQCYRTTNKPSIHSLNKSTTGAFTISFTPATLINSNNNTYSAITVAGFNTQSQSKSQNQSQQSQSQYSIINNSNNGSIGPNQPDSKYAAIKNTVAGAHSRSFTAYLFNFGKLFYSIRILIVYDQ